MPTAAPEPQSRRSPAAARTRSGLPQRTELVPPLLGVGDPYAQPYGHWLFLAVDRDRFTVSAGYGPPRSFALDPLREGRQAALERLLRLARFVRCALRRRALARRGGPDPGRPIRGCESSSRHRYAGWCGTCPTPPRWSATHLTSRCARAPPSRSGGCSAGCAQRSGQASRSTPAPGPQRKTCWTCGPWGNGPAPRRAFAIPRPSTCAPSDNRGCATCCGPGRSSSARTQTISPGPYGESSWLPRQWRPDRAPTTPRNCATTTSPRWSRPSAPHSSRTGSRPGGATGCPSPATSSP